MRFLLRIRGKWELFKSAKSARGYDADRLIWIDPPRGTDEERTVLECVGNDLSKVGVLDNLVGMGDLVTNSPGWADAFARGKVW